MIRSKFYYSQLSDTAKLYFNRNVHWQVYKYKGFEPKFWDLFVAFKGLGHSLKLANH